MRYDQLRLRRKLTPPIFIANVAVLIFTDEVMRKSSVTGTISNAHKKKGVTEKPHLSTEGLEAVHGNSNFPSITVV